MYKFEEAQLLPKLTPRKIYEELDKYVIGQERAKRAVAIATYNHIKRTNALLLGKKTLLKKSNLLLIGPTGCGKTHIARQLARILGVSFVSVDATEYTEAGYYGKDVEIMVGELLFANDLDVSATERGIIFIDEVDKIARRINGMRTGASGRDIGGEGVQQALLKLLEGRKIFVPMNITQNWSQHEFVQVDTTNILFICAGTFSDVWDYQLDGSLGFGAKVSGKRVIKRIRREHLIEFGMLPEFLGRIPVIVQLHPLSESDLVRILTEPPDAIVKEYQQLLAEEGIELEFTKGALHQIAQYAMKTRLGARALRIIMEEVLHDLLFEAPEKGGGRLRVDAGFVKRRINALEKEGFVLD